MIAQLSPALEKRLRRADPIARPIVEVLAVLREDTRRRKDHWDDLDSLTGVALLEEGGVRLAGSIGSLVEHTTSTGFLTDFADDANGLDLPVIRWTGSEATDWEVNRIKLWLHPKVDGGQPKTVAEWRVRLYAVSELVGSLSAYNLRLEPLGTEVVVAAAGTSASLVTFDFTGQVALPRPKRLLPQNAPGVAFFAYPTTLVAISAVQADGTPASNVGLGYDSGSAEVGTATKLSTRSLRRLVSGTSVEYQDNGSAGGAPRMAVEVASFSSATVGFTGVGNQFDLGATPSGTVEFVARAALPAGTAVTFEVRNDGDTAWLPFSDGQTSEEIGVSKRQTYKVRLTLTPDTGGDVTPEAWEIGARELAIHSLDGIAVPRRCSWGVDPVDLRAEIPELELAVQRDGERDFRDLISQLISSYDIGALEFRVFYGHPGLARTHWWLVDSFPVFDDYLCEPTGIRLILLSALATLKQALPIPRTISTSGVNLSFVHLIGYDRITRASGSFIADGWKKGYLVTVLGSASNDGTYRLFGVEDLILHLVPTDDLTTEGPVGGVTLSARLREPQDYLNQSLKAVHDDLMQNALAVPDRWRGAGIANTTDLVSKSIIDSEAKAELDAIAFIAGGAMTTEAGRITFVDMHRGRGLAARFRSEDIRMLGVTPGLRQRMPELHAGYGWDETLGDFYGDARAYNQAALDAMGRAYIDAPQRIPDQTAQWFPQDSDGLGSLASATVERQVAAFGTGLTLLHFRSLMPYPELRVGHEVAVQTDQFIARDPFTARALSGKLWTLGVVRRVLDMGREFIVWVRSLTDVVASSERLDRDPLGPPTIDAMITPLAQTPGQAQIRLSAQPLGSSIKYVIQDVGAEVPAYDDSSWQAYSGPITVTQLATLDRQVAAYADNHGRRSVRRTWLVETDTEPDVSLSLVQMDADTVRFQWVPDPNVVAVDLYEKVGGWPTSDGTLTGQLDSAQYVGRIEVDPDGKSKAANGSDLANVLDAAGTRRTGIGGTKWEKDGYSTGNVIYAIAVPLAGPPRRAVGARANAQLTVATSGGAALTGFSAAKTAAGSSCPSGAQITVSWTPNGSVADGTHDLLIYRRNIFGGRTLVKTEASPVSTTSYVDTVEDFESVGSGVFLDWVYEYELVVAGPAVVDSGQAPAARIESSGMCPLS